jgi:hypothetical protein
LRIDRCSACTARSVVPIQSRGIVSLTPASWPGAWTRQPWCELKRWPSVSLQGWPPHDAEWSDEIMVVGPSYCPCCDAKAEPYDSELLLDDVLVSEDAA